MKSGGGARVPVDGVWPSLPQEKGLIRCHRAARSPRVGAGPPGRGRGTVISGSVGLRAAAPFLAWVSEFAVGHFSAPSPPRSKRPQKPTGDTCPKSIFATNVNNLHNWNHATEHFQLCELLTWTSCIVIVGPIRSRDSNYESGFPKTMFLGKAPQTVSVPSQTRSSKLGPYV